MKPRRQHQFRLATVLSARGGYAAIILAATILEVVAFPQLSSAGWRLRRALEPALAWRDAYDAIRNVFLFAGFGAVWLVTSPPGRLRVALLRATLVGMSLSVAVEALQLFTERRLSSVADVVTNTVGAFTGALAAGLLVAAVRARRGHRGALGLPLFLFAIGQAGALLPEALAPLFRSVPIVTLGGGPRSRLLGTLAQAQPVALADISALDVMLAIPFGAFACVALRELRMTAPRAWLVTILGGSAFVATAEVMHGIAGIAIQWSAVASRTIGIVLGASLALWLAPTLGRFGGVARARFIAIVSILTAVAWYLRPFRLRDSMQSVVSALTHARLLPLREWPYTTGLLSVNQVLQTASLGFMLGALLEVWPLQRRGLLGYVWPAAIFAALLELAHALIAGRIVDVTGSLILFAGAWLGDAVVRRAGFTAYGTMLD